MIGTGYKQRPLKDAQTASVRDSVWWRHSVHWKGEIRMPFPTGFRTATRLIALPLRLGLVLNGATGVSVPQLTAFDDFMNGLLEKWQIPGAALGVSRHGVWSENWICLKRR